MTRNFKARPPKRRRIARRTGASFRTRKYTNITRIMPREGLPLPPKLRTVLTYCHNGVTGGGAGGTLSTHQFSLNNVFDPDVTGAGHQPMGYDQLMSLYQFCRVIKAKVKTIFSCGTATGNSPIVGMQFTENSSYSPSAFGVILERGNVSYDIMPQQAGYANKIMVKRNWDASKWYPKTQQDDEQYACTASAGPTGEQAYINIFAVGPGSGGGTYFDHYFHVIIQYEVEFYGQVQLNQS